MNKIYKSVWNESVGAWVAVSEQGQARGKRSGRLTKTALTAAIFASAATSAFASVSLDGGDPSGGGAAIAIGNGSIASGLNDAIAIGDAVKSTVNDAVSIGSQITNDAVNSVVLGSNFLTLDAGSTQTVFFAPNGGTVTKSANSFAFNPDHGTGTSDSNDSINLACVAKNAQGGVALGSNSTVTAANSVALGAARRRELQHGFRRQRNATAHDHVRQGGRPERNQHRRRQRFATLRSVDENRRGQEQVPRSQRRRKQHRLRDGDRYRQSGGRRQRGRRFHWRRGGGRRDRLRFSCIGRALDGDRSRRYGERKRRNCDRHPFGCGPRGQRFRGLNHGATPDCQRGEGHAGHRRRRTSPN